MGNAKSMTMTKALPYVLDALCAHQMPVLRAWYSHRGTTTIVEMQGATGTYNVSTTRYDIMALHSIFTGSIPPTTRKEVEDLMLLHFRKTVATYKNKKSDPFWVAKPRE